MTQVKAVVADAFRRSDIAASTHGKVRSAAALASANALESPNLGRIAPDIANNVVLLSSAEAPSRRTGMNLRELQIAHGHATANRAEVERSATCRCFHCLQTFPAQEITEWIPDRTGETAICPRCGIDSVIGSSSGLSMSDTLFEEMRNYWFR